MVGFVSWYAEQDLLDFFPMAATREPSSLGLSGTFALLCLSPFPGRPASIPARAVDFCL